jgi:hypothetical protein
MGFAGKGRRGEPASSCGQLLLGWPWLCPPPEYSSRRSSIATSMAGSITTCSITSSVPMSATGPAHSRPITPAVGIIIDAAIVRRRPAVAAVAIHLVLTFVLDQR